MAKEVRKYTAAELIQMLRGRYTLPSYAFIEQVPNGTSNNKTRTADAIAMGCWKSVSIELHGFEVKVLRSDWLKEIQQPEKSAMFQRHCHRWWIVAAPGIVKLEEMPAEWGLMEPIESGGLKVRKAASLRTPEPVSFEFLAGLLRKHCSDDEIQKRIDQARRDGRNEGLNDAQKASKSFDEKMQKNFDELAMRVLNFEAASGIRIGSYAGPNIGEATRAYRRLIEKPDLQWSLDRIKATAEQMKQDAELLEKHIAEVPMLEESA